MLLSSHSRQKTGISISTSIQESNATLIYWRFGAPRIGKAQLSGMAGRRISAGWQGS
jgi:hypothetical protein